MRIRFFAYFYPPCIGGGEVILANQAKALARRGHEVHVHCTAFTNLDLSTATDHGDSLEEGVHVHRHRSWVLPMSNPLEKDAVTPGMWRGAWAPADLQVCMGYPSLHLDACSVRHRVAGPPLIVQNYVTAGFLDEILDGQGGPNKRIRSLYWHTWVRRQLRRSSLVLADSPLAAEGLRSRLGLDNVAYHMGSGVDPDEFEALTEADLAGARAELGLGEDRLLVAPSRISWQKGADLLVQAAGPLLGEGWRLVFLGPVNEPDYHREVLDLAAPHGDRVVFGRLPRPRFLALMADAAAVCLPSRGEAGGGVVLEGMCAGRTVVCSDGVEAAREDYLEHGVNGLMHPVGDVEALRACLVRAMTEDLSAMQAAARDTVLGRYTWEASVDHLWGLWNQAAGGRLG